jgi:hypothetical protein
MSLGYAEKLSYIEDVGKVGMTEYFDPPHVLQEKVESLIFPIHIIGFFALLGFFFVFVFVFGCF